jgi:hypothetical protein
MGFFKNLFSKGESKGDAFVPAPTQSIPGLEPIIVHTIENLFPTADDQKQAFTYLLELKEQGRGYRDTKLLLALLSFSAGNIQKLQSSVLQPDPRFWGEEIAPIFPKMKAAEEWVKSITRK